MKTIPFKKLRRARWLWSERMALRKTINTKEAKKIILGAGYTSYEGWIKTDYPFFDITNANHWNFLFKKNKPLNLLCEHVLEHFTEKDVRLILTLAHKHLEKGGNIRIAVPDKNHPNPAYIEYVRPNGSGWGADDHRSFWNYENFQKLAAEIGFETQLLEYCCDNKKIESKKFDLENGVISRSIAYGFKNEIENYSSLIIDAVKKQA